MVNSIWNPSLFHMDSTEFHMESGHIHHGFHGQVHMDSMEQVHMDSMEQIQMELMTHICSVLTILRKKKFTLSRNRTLSHTSKTNTKAQCATTAFLYGKQKPNIYYPRHVSTQMRQRWLKHCHIASSFPPPPSSTQPIHHGHRAPATMQQWR